MQEVRIEPLEKEGHTLWQVRMGRRALAFDDEAAARAFAAQLHMRLSWLQQEAQLDQTDSTPGEKA